AVDVPAGVRAGYVPRLDRYRAAELPDHVADHRYHGHRYPVVRGDGRGGTADILPHAALRLCAVLPQGRVASRGADTGSVQGSDSLLPADPDHLCAADLVPVVDHWPAGEDGRLQLEASPSCSWPGT